MNIPDPEFLGIYFSSDYPDRSGGTNLRYGKKSPLGKYGRFVVGRFKDLKVGDFIRLTWVKGYGHGAHLQVTKINKKSLKAVECAKSYGAGTLWTISQYTEAVTIEECYMSEERLHELARAWRDTLDSYPLELRDYESIYGVGSRN